MGATSDIESVELSFYDAMMERFRPTDDCQLDPGPALGTCEYFGRRGWEGMNVLAGGDLMFVAWSDDGIRLMVTSSSGSIKTEVRFDFSLLGVAMFAAAADAAAKFGGR